ncbi:MAG: hypothetical protein ACFFFG_17490 [Candidatus Thorarchaeota archaeon]
MKTLKMYKRQVICIAIIFGCLSLQLNGISAAQSFYRGAEDAWIHTDPGLTGTKGNGGIRADHVNDLGIYAYGGFWIWEWGLAQITLDMKLGGDKFYINVGEYWQIKMRWRFNGYHQDSGSDSWFAIDYYILKYSTGTTQEDYITHYIDHWSWAAPDPWNEWNGEYVTHSHIFYPHSSDYYRVVMAISCKQTTQFSAYVTNFLTGDRYIKCISVTGELMQL